MKKRGFMLLAVFITAIFLTSCGDKSQKEDVKQNNLKQILVGYDLYEPYAYIDSNGNVTGSDIEIAKEAFQRMGYEPVFKEITWGKQKELLKNKTIDCVWCGFSIDGREKQYQWTRPYLRCSQKIVVRSDSGIRKLSDLKGKKIAVQAATKTEEYFLKQQSKGKLLLEEIATCNNLTEAVAAFNKGYTDAVAAHDEALRYYTKENKESYRFLDKEILQTKLGVAFDLHYDQKIVAKLSDTIDKMIQDGTVKKIVSKYGIDSRQLVEGKTSDR